MYFYKNRYFLIVFLNLILLIYVYKRFKSVDDDNIFSFGNYNLSYNVGLISYQN